jgi:hypothetical protein
MAPLPFREVSLAEPAGLCRLHEELRYRLLPLVW